MTGVKGVSLFAGAGVAETYLKEIGIDIVVANELIESRANFYQHLHPFSKMVIGDIRDKTIKEEIEKHISPDTKLLLATPPCQGVSSLGKNKLQDHYEKDDRNFLVFEIFYFVDKHQFDYILIENVARFIKVLFPYQGISKSLFEILKDKYSDKYNIEGDVLNAKDYGVPQNRPRMIIKMFKKGLSWPWPIKQPEITLRDAISHLPSLESGEKSNIKWHYSKTHNPRDIMAMKHTPTGQSAFKNQEHYPKREDNQKINGFSNTYKRMSWDEPASIRTMNNGNIGSHSNVHPGYPKLDGTYSDARVLTIHELLIISSLPTDWNIPNWASETLIRQVIGEGVPPLLMKNILGEIKIKIKEDNREFWIIQRHSSNMRLLVEVAKYLLKKQGNSIGKEEFKSILEDLKEKRVYRSRNGTIINTLGTKISQLCYFMIGYRDRSKKNFIFSPLGKLYLDNFYTENPTNRNYIFLTLLFAIQYPHPHSKSLDCQLFPFRLIFKLLTDVRLGNILYNYEVFMLVMKTKSSTIEDYEKLIQEILEHRSKSDEEIEKLIKDNSYRYVIPLTEWDLYTIKLLKSHDLISVKEVSFNKIGLFHKPRKENVSAKRIYQKKSISINNNYIDFVKDLLEEWKFDEKPIQLDDPNSLYIENVKLIYSKLPNVLLKYNVVNKENKKDRELFDIPKLIVSHSQNIENKSSELFEKVIERAMNLFDDVKAERISGAGNTDIECLYIISENDKHKFNVDAKSTAKKLIQINPGRLKQHIAKTNAKYCIVVTPQYSPGAIRDIQGENIVVLTSASLSEFINLWIISNQRELSFKGIHEIITDNYGCDISEKVYNLISKTYGSGVNLGDQEC